MISTRDEILRFAQDDTGKGLAVNECPRFFARFTISEEKMKAARFYGGKDIRVENSARPEPEPDEVQVRVQAAGICGSDLHSYHAGVSAKGGSPRIRGHELSGTVAAVGNSVSKIAIGDRVVVEPIVPCNDCPECMSGNYNLCSNLIHLGGKNGGFAEFMAAPARSVYALPESLSFEEGALAEVFAVAVHALSRVPVNPGDRVAVIGSGPIGLSIVQMANLSGASSVAVLGKPDGPLQLAQETMGVTPINVDTDDVDRAVESWSGGRGADVVFEAVGGNAPTFQQAAEIAAIRGRVGMVGGHRSPITVDPDLTRKRELTVSWCFCYGRQKGKSDFQTAVDLLSVGKLDATPLITHRFPLDEITQAFATAAGRDEHGSIKVLVFP